MLPLADSLSYWHHQLVLGWYILISQSHIIKVLQKCVGEWRTSRPIDGTPGIPESNKNAKSSKSLFYDDILEMVFGCLKLRYVGVHVALSCCVVHSCLIVSFVWLCSIWTAGFLVALFVCFLLRELCALHELPWITLTCIGDLES